MPWDPQIWVDTLNQILSDVLAWLPNLAIALLLLLVGWIISRIVQALTAGLLRRVGLDRLAERAGAGEVLTRMGFGPSAVDVLARIVYWLISLVFILAAMDALGLQGVVEALRGLIDYLPNVLAAALILLFGGLIARLVGDGAGALAERSGVEEGTALGQLVMYTLLLFVVILALGQLGLETALLTTVTMAFIGAAAVALALAFGLGSRELARDIMAGFHVRESFMPGQTLTVGDTTGKLVHVGAVKTVLEAEGRQISLPNRLLAEGTVSIDGPSEG